MRKSGILTILWLILGPTGAQHTMVKNKIKFGEVNSTVMFQISCKKRRLYTALSRYLQNENRSGLCQIFQRQSHLGAVASASKLLIRNVSAHTPVLPCKAKRQYLLTLQVRKYCLLAWSRVGMQAFAYLLQVLENK